MKAQNTFKSFLGSLNEMKRNELSKYQMNGIYDLHFETEEDKAEQLKKTYGKKVGETSTKKQIEAADYSLNKFRKLIGFSKGDYTGVFLPGSYDAAVSELGDGPHKKAVKKVKWTQKKYDQWLSDVASNGGAKNAADMAQNAKEESGLIDWVKKQFRGDDPMQRIKWDIEGFAESVVTEAKFVKDFDKAVLNVSTKEEILKLYPDAKFFIGKPSHFFGELETNLFFKAYYTKKQGEFEIKSVYSKKNNNYTYLFNESVVTEAKLKFTKADISYQLTLDYSGRTKPRVKKFTTKEIHVVYGYKVDPQSVIDSIKILDPDLKVTHIKWNDISSGGGTHSFKINESASNESINEGKWGNIMKGVRKGSKSGPWTVVSIQNNKVVNQEHVDIMDAIPAFYEKAKKEFPKARISIEDNEGHIVYNESKVTKDLENTLLFEQYLNEGVLFGKKGIKNKLADKIRIAKVAVGKFKNPSYAKTLDKLEKQFKSGKIDAKNIQPVQGTSEQDMPDSFDIFDGGNSNQLAVQIAKVLKKYKKHETDNSQTPAAAGWSGTAMSSVSGKIQAGVSFGTGRETYLIGVMIGSGIPSNISDKIKQEIYNLLFIFDQFGGNDGGVYVSDSQGSNYDSIGLICRKYSFNDAVGRSLTDIMNNR